MAARPQVEGWNNVNLNKPEEYSSEFVQDGKRYAVVVNANNGQKQLYFVSGGLGITNRSLLQTTNANGSIVPPNEQTQRNLEDFKRTQGGDKALEKALDTAKKQSYFIVQKASTEEELEALKETKEYKALKIAEETGTNSSELITFDTDPKIVLNGANCISEVPLVYPIDIESTKQDRIKFQAVTLSARKGAYNPVEYSPICSPVYISIQGPIVDTNTVQWGESKVFGGGGVAYGAASELLGEGGKDFSEDIMSKAKELQGDIGDLTGALAAGNMDIFTRVSQKVFNPNLELIFKEPKLRPFAFTFKMSARNDREAQQIKKIIKYFKFHMAPKGGGGDLFLKTPEVFWIEYQKGTELHPSLNLIAPEKLKSKACALQSFSVNYTPLGTYMTYDDEEATMIQYDLTMQFSEITPVYQKDFDDEPAKNHPIGY